MSRVYEALRRAETGRAAAAGAAGPSAWATTLSLASSDRSPDAAAEPVFAVAAPQPTANSRLVCWSSWDSPAAEAFRQLAARLLHLRERWQQERRLQTLLCTSSVPQEGKSVVAANLAVALARTSARRVLLLEGDLRRPAQAALWGLEPEPGLAQWIGAGQAPQNPPPVLRLGESAVYLLPAGAAAAASAGLEFLESPRAAQLLMALSGCFEWVVVDAPPLLATADAHAWARLADGVLLVARANRSRKAQVREALRGLETRNLLGMVLNQNPEPVLAYPPHP
ncbi:MAG: CpsD/CapB family tyrosine-protein kinase [Terriglobales bacterium]